MRNQSSPQQSDEDDDVDLNAKNEIMAPLLPSQIPSIDPVSTDNVGYIEKDIVQRRRNRKRKHWDNSDVIDDDLIKKRRVENASTTDNILDEDDGDESNEAVECVSNDIESPSSPDEEKMFVRL